MGVPTATYRIQFNPNFNFNAAYDIIPYLAELGISDLYASPIFKACQGSQHGYDVVDPNQLNPDLGTVEEFDRLIEHLQQNQMGWLQDIVPNHMAYDSQNLWLMNVLEFGEDSPYADCFDIDWEHPNQDLKGRILTPLLGDFYGKCLERGEIQLSYGETGLKVNYYELSFPLRMSSYAKVLARDLGRLSKVLGQEHPDFMKLLGILYILNSIPSEVSRKQRQDQATFVKYLLWELYSGNSEIQEFIDSNIRFFNGKAGQPESFDALDNILSEQYFRLAFWKVGSEELNYRRFFSINRLVSLRVENERVYKITHRLIQKLIQSGKVTGLRIDHLDGLYDPTRYLERLRETCGELYIVVEKILELEQDYLGKFEEIPREWPIQGTSGYDFLNCLNGLFFKREHHRYLSELYASLTGIKTPYEELVVQKKQLIIDKNLAGDIHNLATLLKGIAQCYRYGRDFTHNGLRRALQELLALFPVYRIYVNLDGTLNQRDQSYVEEAVQQAKFHVPQLINELNFIEQVLMLDFDESLSQEEQLQWLHFVSKFQQLSGPLMAKGIEDTLFYVYNRFIAFNEVGGQPPQAGISVLAFHNFCQNRRDNWPLTMNTTSTHDTKRSEDIRARLQVLSEIPEEWATQVKGWQELNQQHKIRQNGYLIPDANDEYFLYQTLVGAYPLDEAEYASFVERIKSYLIKAVREAKVHTAWLQPDTDYEEGFLKFVEKLLEPAEDNRFLPQLRQFQEWVSFYGALNSLTQTLLKITAPGIPDFYQGTELWDLSLVDPDNRRPVDFEHRFALLKEIKRGLQTNPLELLAELKQNWRDGRLKLLLITQALATRNQNQALFEAGNYEPLEVLGPLSEHIVAFARRYDHATVIVVASRFFTPLLKAGTFQTGELVWGSDTYIELPADFPTSLIDSLTGQAIQAQDALPVSIALEHLPVALLISN